MIWGYGGNVSDHLYTGSYLGIGGIKRALGGCSSFTSGCFLPLSSFFLRIVTATSCFGFFFTSGRPVCHQNLLIFYFVFVYITTSLLRYFMSFSIASSAFQSIVMTWLVVFFLTCSNCRFVDLFSAGSTDGVLRAAQDETDLSASFWDGVGFSPFAKCEVCSRGWWMAQIVQDGWCLDSLIRCSRVSRALDSWSECTMPTCDNRWLTLSL